MLRRKKNYNPPIGQCKYRSNRRCIHFFRFPADTVKKSTGIIRNLPTFAGLFGEENSVLCFFLFATKHLEIIDQNLGNAFFLPGSIGVLAGAQRTFDGQL